MTDTIWLVSQGEYSDYRIVAAFSNEEAATRHVEEWNALVRSPGSSSERFVDPREVWVVPPRLAVLHRAEWWSFGDRDVYLHQSVELVGESTGRLDHLNASHYDGGHVSFHCVSFDPERVVKIVSDARAKHLAQEAGL